MAQDGPVAGPVPRDYAVEGGADATRQLSSAIRALDLENRRLRAGMARRVSLSDSEFGAIALISEVQTATPKVLAHELGLTTGAVTALIDRLEADSLIERRAHPSDRRSTVLALTRSGASVKEWIYGSYRRAIAEAVQVTGDADVLIAAATLRRAAAFVRAATEQLEGDIPGFPADR